MAVERVRARESPWRLDAKEENMNDAIQAMRRGGRRATGLGVLVMVLGILAMLAPLLTGMSIAFLVGILVLIAGISRLYWAFQAESPGRGVILFLIGGLTAVCGIAMIANPIFAAGVLTAVLALYLLFDGMAEIVMALAMKPLSGWGCMLFAGIVSLLLGLLVWTQFPLSGPWAIGLLLGIKLFVIGLLMITVGTVARDLASSAEE